MPTWPTSLPQNLQISSFDETFQNGSIRQDMDSGPSYQRQRFTAAPEKIKGELFLDKTQYSTLKTFWTNDTAHGALSFDWKHPITGNAATVQFDVSNPPKVSALSGDQFTVTIMIEVLP